MQKSFYLITLIALSNRYPVKFEKKHEIFHDRKGFECVQFASLVAAKAENEKRTRRTKKC